LFDLVIVVDWSAAARPATGADSIWFCVHDTASDRLITLRNVATRHAAAIELTEVLRHHPRSRILVGFDFAFGYPEGFVAAAGLAGDHPWLATWDHLGATVTDSVDNRNNRFAVASALNAAISPGVGPFWGVGSATHITTSLSPTKAPGFPHSTATGPLAETRLTERAVFRSGRRPFSVWQLNGAGSVGGQTLTGIPVVRSLRNHPVMAGRAAVWPFDTGLVPDPTADRTDAVIFAEVWPSGIDFDRGRHAVKDAAQVLSLAAYLAHLDRMGGLGALFAPSLAADARDRVVTEEGWILA
jgi:precorrin-8X/cobalt-precorrin-8 methylmutase